ncbi:hypothetical protein ACHHYP_12838 [Achlya hypogyna]|uniref:BZIP domain-containing protein n=1 Tax=Achlya hypogyna TaxID=1202772 RepID=A0A1V9ZG66_ACHHY|nr:hypothetical protein ACHHYP_12838 [Achlya hypogyna]
MAAGAPGEVDEAILHRRARKRKNSRAWRIKHKDAVQSLRQTADLLERQVADLRMVAAVPQQALGADSSLWQRYETIIKVKHGLIQQNALLQQAIERRGAIYNRSVTTLLDMEVDNSRIWDDFFLYNVLQATQRDVESCIPGAFGHSAMPPKVIRGWLANMGQVGLGTYYDVRKVLGNTAFTDFRDVSEYHWKVRNDKDAYMRLQNIALDFKMLRQSQSLSVSRSVLQIGPNTVVRIMLQYQIQLHNGFDYCFINMTPDLEQLTTTMRVRLVVEDGQVHVSATGKAQAPNGPPPDYTMSYVISEMLHWEDLLRASGCILWDEIPKDYQRLADTQIYDDIFVVSRIEAALCMLQIEVPRVLSMMDSAPLAITMHGWRVRGACHDGHLFALVDKALDIPPTLQVRELCARFWAIRNDEALFLQVNTNATSYAVLHRPHEDLTVVQTELKSIQATRILLQYQVHVADGFNHLVVYLSPDLADMTTYALMEHRVVDSRLIVRGRIIVRRSDKIPSIDAAMALELLSRACIELSQAEAFATMNRRWLS